MEQFKILEFNCHIKGTAPLLFSRFPEEDNPDGKLKGKKAPLNRAEQVEKSLYRMKDGTIFTPADHILGSMIKAGTYFKLEGKKTYKDVIKGGVFVEPQQIPHINQKYEEDWRSTVIPATRGRIMVGRARMDEWELRFKIKCLDPRATAENIAEILAYAGAYQAIGGFRPRYGRFEVIKCELIK